MLFVRFSLHNTILGALCLFRNMNYPPIINVSVVRHTYLFQIIYNPATKWHYIASKMTFQDCANNPNREGRIRASTQRLSWLCIRLSLHLIARTEKSIYSLIHFTMCEKIAICVGFSFVRKVVHKLSTIRSEQLYFVSHTIFWTVWMPFKRSMLFYLASGSRPYFPEIRILTLFSDCLADSSLICLLFGSNVLLFIPILTFCRHMGSIREDRSLWQAIWCIYMLFRPFLSIRAQLSTLFPLKQALSPPYAANWRPKTPSHRRYPAIRYLCEALCNISTLGGLARELMACARRLAVIGYAHSECSIPCYLDNRL